MNLNFVLNDYILMWNLLFLPSITKDIQQLKQNLWKNYRHSYHRLEKEEIKILKDPKNYIPDDDTIFDMIKASPSYQKIYQETEAYRSCLLTTWDEYKKRIIKDFKNILRFDIKLYHILVINPNFEVMDMKVVKTRKVNTMTWGRQEDIGNYLQAIISILSHVVQKELILYQQDYQEIVQAVIELAVDNELATRIFNRSVYLTGDESLRFLKRQIYPYWLMYLGVAKEDFSSYMKRDKILFDVDKYTYERQLAGLDLCSFIDFCVKNQRHIVKISELEII